MRNRTYISLMTATVCASLAIGPTFAQTGTAGIDDVQTALGAGRQGDLAAAYGEANANTTLIPGQILRTGINLTAPTVSRNSLQLSDMLGLTPLLERLQILRKQVDDSATIENLSNRQTLLETQVKAQQILHEAELAVDYATSEINAENEVYSEVASTWQAKANKVTQVTNWASYYSNGALWAAAEALTIPTWKRPKYAIPSGTLGIIAGVIPSMFSLYAMHAAGGKKYPGEGAPNMLAKLFDQPVNVEVDYPDIVWRWLNTVPAGNAAGKTRKDEIIDRWVSDANIPAFTDRKASAQLAAIAGDSTGKKDLNISLMQTRAFMLSQLGSEILKMKRLLLELEMVVSGEKRI